MKFEQQYIQGVWLIEPKRFGDNRGYFCETFKLAEFEANIGKVNFIQENESMSRYGVVRGLHFQKGEWSQAKLVRVSQGRILDVVVDLRGDSATFGKTFQVELSADNGLQLFIPKGFAHGFAVLSEMTQFQYKVDNVYCPESECTLKFDDPELGIDWLLPSSEMILSEKDLRGLPLKNIKPF